MTELVIKIDESKYSLITELVTQLGGEVQQPKAKKRTAIKKANSEKPDPLAFFGKYPDFPLDPETFREQLWGRKKSL